MNTIPPILYQYFRYENAINFLNQSAFKISLLNRTNDPFEFLPKYEPIQKYDQLKKQLKINQVRDGYLRKHASNSQFIAKFGIVNEVNWDKFTEEYEADILAEYFVTAPTIFRYSLAHLKDELNDKIGIICFSELKNSILMWSHYADSHQGIVIGFNFTSRYDLYKEIQKVKYKQLSPSLKAGFVVENINKRIFNRIACTKHKEWSYEKEYRLPIKLKEELRFGNNYYLPVPGLEISEIVFRMKVSSENVNRIKSLYTNDKVKYRRYSISDHHYYIELKDI